MVFDYTVISIIILVLGGSVSLITVRREARDGFRLIGLIENDTMPGIGKVVSSIIQSGMLVFL